VKATVTLGSSRPGGLDISFAGLAAQSFQDFEVIFIDARYHLRHEAVLDAWARTGATQPLIHVPNHRISGTPWPNQSCGYNTGFMLAAGEVVVMMMDYAFAEPTWLAEHVAAHEAGERRMVIGEKDVRWPLPMRMKDGQPPRDFDPATLDEAWLAERYASFDEVSSLAEPFDPPRIRALPRKEFPLTETHWVNVRTKNESFRLEDLLAVNGMDEHYDYYQGPGDSDIGYRLDLHGCVAHVIPPRLICADPRDVLPNGSKLMHSATHRAPPPWHWKPCWAEGCAYFESVKKAGRKVAPNPYSLREKREELWGWRELSQKREIVMASRVVSDMEYYNGGC
jgi:hypothetical protein